MTSQYTCPWVSCRKSYANKSSIKLHYDIEHAGLRYPCVTCGEVFKSKRSLGGHNKSEHLNMKNWRKSKKLECPECDEGPYATQSGLDRHILKRHREQQFFCQTCNEGFQSPEALTYHTKRAHEGLNFDCTICGVPFASKQNLQKHVDRNPSCFIATPAKASPIPVERKRKLGEVDKSPAQIFLDALADKMKDSCTRECRHNGCTKWPAYGLPGGDKMYCKEHRDNEDGIISLTSLCVYKGCIKRGHSTVTGTRYRFCAPHRDQLVMEGLPAHTVTFPKNTSRCLTPDCDTVPSKDGGKYCAKHSPTGRSDDKRACSMACCVNGGPRPQYVHPDNGSTICAFGARVLMEVALMDNDIERSRKLMKHFNRSTMMVLNQQSAFRTSIESKYWGMLDNCTKVCFDEPVSGKPKTTGDLRPDIFYIWEISGEKMAIHIEYDESSDDHEDDDARLKWISEASDTVGRVYIIRVNGKSGSNEALCTRVRMGDVVFYRVNSVGKAVAQEVAEAVMQRIEWIKHGLAPDENAGRPYKVCMCQENGCDKLSDGSAAFCVSHVGGKMG